MPLDARSFRFCLGLPFALISTLVIACGGDVSGVAGPSGSGGLISTGGSGGSKSSGGGAGGSFGGSTGFGGSTSGGGSSASGGTSSGAVPSCTAAWSNTAPSCGSTVTANWSCSNANTCTYQCSGDVTQSGSIPCTGTTKIAISQDLSCLLTSHNGKGSTTSSYNVSCDGKPACSVHFEVPGPPAACPVSGEAVWSCSGATSCSYVCTGSLAGSGSVSCNGSLPVTLTQSSSCVITATNAAGSVTATVAATCP